MWNKQPKGNSFTLLAKLPYYTARPVSDPFLCTIFNLTFPIYHHKNIYLFKITDEINSILFYSNKILLNQIKIKIIGPSLGPVTKGYAVLCLICPWRGVYTKQIALRASTNKV